MTRIRYDRENCCMEFFGHAGSEEAGRDLVCAAVSILLYTLIDAVQDRAETLTPSICMADGKASVRCHTAMRDRQEADTIYGTVFTGCERLAREFPQYVEAIKIEEV